MLKYDPMFTSSWHRPLAAVWMMTLHCQNKGGSGMMSCNLRILISQRLVDGWINKTWESDAGDHRSFTVSYHLSTFFFIFFSFPSLSTTIVKRAVSLLKLTMKVTAILLCFLTRNHNLSITFPSSYLKSWPQSFPNPHQVLFLSYFNHLNYKWWYIKKNSRRHWWTTLLGDWAKVGKMLSRDIFNL